MNLRLPSLGIAVALIVSACAVGPDYVRPTTPTPQSFKEVDGWKSAQPQDHLPHGEWWKLFADPDLDALEAQVDIDNQTIKGAEARVRQARAATDAARAALFPLVTGNAQYTRGNAGGGRSVTTTSGNTATIGSSGPRNNYNLALDVSWEADLWGRVRRQVEASGETAQASEADLQSAKLAAQAQLAQSYFLLRVQDAEIKLFDDTIAAYEKSLQLTRNQYAAGIVARAEVVQAETQLKSTQAQAIDARIQRAQLEHAIAVLIGKAPADLSIDIKPAPNAFPDIPIGVPSQLLERRPDVAAAERRTAAANAQIGVAEAAFFPALTLSATGGFQSSLLSQLFSAPARYWSLGPAIAQVIFDAGLRKAQTAQAIATYEENVATYRQTVLAGFQEVEDNLAALRILEQEAEVQADAVRSAEEALRIALNQYRAGTINYLAVIIIQAAALSNERTALSILGRRYTASVTLVKALGGGWDTTALAGRALRIAR